MKEEIKSEIRKIMTMINISKVNENTSPMIHRIAQRRLLSVYNEIPSEYAGLKAAVGEAVSSENFLELKLYMQRNVSQEMHLADCLDHQELVRGMEAIGYEPVYLKGFSDDLFLTWRDESGDPDRDVSFDGWEAVEGFIIDVNRLKENYSMQELIDRKNGNYEKLPYGTYSDYEMNTAIRMHEKEKAQPGMNNERQRLFVDMDGTLAEFKTVDHLEALYEQGYFLNLKPHENVIDAVREIIVNHPETEVFIMSSVLSDSHYALEEKNAWLDQYLSEVDREHRIFPPCGENKLDYVPDGIRMTDHLLDDYTQNLVLWEPPAKGIKLLNGINHTKGIWSGNMLRYDKSGEEIAANIMEVMNGKMLQEEVPQIKTALQERSPKI